MGDQGVEAASESEGGGDDHDGERRAEQGRAHRHRCAALAALEGEADPSDHRRRRPAIGCEPGHGRGPSRPASPSEAAGRGSIGDGEAADHDGAREDEEPDPQDEEVEGEPRGGIDGPDRADGRKRRQQNGDADGEQATGHGRAQDAEEIAAKCRRSAGTKGSQHVAVLFSCLELAGDHLQCDEQGRAKGDGTEDEEGYRLGLDGAVDLALHDRGDVERIGRAPGQGGDDLLFHRRDPCRAVAQLQTA